MVPSVGSRDMYFNVEWISNYPEEAERLFVCAFELQIIDIKYLDFELDLWTQNEVLIRCFSLFSSLFEGHFISKMFRSNEEQIETEQLLLSLIRRFKVDNQLEGADGWQSDIEPSLYVQQLFDSLLVQFDDGFKKHIIKSEYLSLSQQLQRELIVFDDADNVIVSPL